MHADIVHNSGRSNTAAENRYSLFRGGYGIFNANIKLLRYPCSPANCTNSIRDFSELGRMTRNVWIEYIRELISNLVGV